MSYKVNRALGYQKWGVTNPWVFANYGQPQRMRGYVSSVVFQTAPPFLKNAHLGTTPTEAELLQRAADDLRRGERMEKMAIAGLVLSAFGTWLMWSRMKREVTPNRRRSTRRRRSRRNTGRVDAGRLDLFDARAMLRGLKKQLPPIRREIRKYQKEIDADDMRWADGDAEKIRNYRAYMRGVVQNYKNEVARLEKSIRELKKRHPQLRTKRAR